MGQATALTPSPAGNDGTSNDDNPLKRKRPQALMDLPQLERRPAVDSKGRTIIYIDDFDFVTVHNLLYFIYTDRVNLRYDRDETESDTFFEAEGCPAPADMFTIYRAAHMYLLERLERRALRALANTCTTVNICERLFNIDFKPYDDVKKEYFQFIIENYDEVKETKEWEGLMNNMVNSTRDTLAYQTSILHEISKELCGPNFNDGNCL